MSIVTDGQTVQSEPDDALAQRKSSLRAWLFSYEIYIIIIIASFLRLYGLQTTEFDGDQADFFHMAHDAVMQGHLVATSTTASIGVYNPPIFIYTLMIPAAISANPVGGDIEIALFAILGVFLTYWFTRRYYGRVAATIASSLAAVTSVSVFYARFIWNPNMLFAFVPLFLIVLFRGAVERKPGWLFPAIFLYGLLYAWHGSALLLGAPFAEAFLLAPKTFRWRDVVLGILSVLVLYASYIPWLIATHTSIFRVLFPVGDGTPVIDSSAWHLYLRFLNPYDKPFTNTVSILYPWQHYFNWIQPAMECLIIVAVVFVLLLALFLRTKKTDSDASRVIASWWRKVLLWVRNLRESPYRCGLLVLLSWQIFPLLYITRHTIQLFPHYLIILMPGPFILIGILLAKSATWLRMHGQWYRLVGVGIYAFSALLLLFQGIAGTATVVDATQGHYVDKNLYFPYYTNALITLQQALAQADQVAQQSHLNRIVVVADKSTAEPLRYLAQQLHTPASVVDDSCLLLPGSTAGPFVVLMPPGETALDAFFSSRYIHVSKSYTSTPLTGDPFRLYVVDPLPQIATQATLSSALPDIQFVNAQAQSLAQTSWVATRWNILQSAPLVDRGTYSYQFTNMDTVNDTTQTQPICTFTSVQRSDQLIAFLPQATNQMPLHIQVARSSTAPYTIKGHILGVFSLAFNTFREDSTPWIVLKTSAGESVITVPVASS